MLSPTRHITPHNDYIGEEFVLKSNLRLEFMADIYFIMFSADITVSYKIYFIYFTSVRN